MHPVHDVTIATAPMGATSGKAVGVDQTGRGGDCRFLRGFVYVLPLTSLFTIEQRRHYGDGSVTSGGDFHLLQRGPHRGTVRRSGDGVKEAAHRLRHQVIPPVAGVGPGLSEVGNGSQDQAGVGRLQGLVAQSQFAQATRGIALDHDICGFRQPQEEVPTRRLLHVQGYPPLVGVEG